ncbi:hypothetical protein P170DRAFT_227495 [Aspergillus steynii IBT 23096]|uniref:Uncharacterized protein n=1 Tax=Aspergillus steynii IBT 23096 TaxID=1392250 RepID=A0A2I2G234_9EURO|nr:uncharacterized protein P170DRAFT_227495 [Aspergillus steynii IBT 23096]PLB46927.1 hypothetical protein P170DRAFT_227495 [Aspergillus steynii IBT 23096]
MKTLNNHIKFSHPDRTSSPFSPSYSHTASWRGENNVIPPPDPIADTCATRLNRKVHLGLPLPLALLLSFFPPSFSLLSPCQLADGCLVLLPPSLGLALIILIKSFLP